MTDQFELAVRYAFPGHSYSLMETGRAMASFTELAVEAFAPELSWASAVAEHADYGELARWESSHVVVFEGRDESGAIRGRAESRLAAGGKGSRIGGSARITIQTVQPTRHLDIETPCDVSHWDVRGGPVDERQVDALRRFLETTLERGSESTDSRQTPVTRAPQQLAEQVTPEDKRVWLEDLEGAGFVVEAREQDGEVSLWILSAPLPDLDALRSARVTLGEILSEAGIDDWDTRALSVLLRLP